jgi:hypothetical protein
MDREERIKKLLNEPQKPSRYYYPEKKVFNRCEQLIKTHFGLDLTFIEKVKLKSYIPIVLNGLDLIDRKKNSQDSYDPFQETISRFMFDYYGLEAEQSDMMHYPGIERHLLQEYCGKIQRDSHHSFSLKD